MSILNRLNKVNKVSVTKTVTSIVYDPNTQETTETPSTSTLGDFIFYRSSGDKSLLSDKIRARVSCVLLVTPDVIVNENDLLNINNDRYNIVFIDNVANLNEVVQVFLEKVV